MARMKFAKIATTETGLTFACADGETLEFDVSDLPEAIVSRLIVHGLKQKLIDAANTKAETLDEYRDLVTSTFVMLAAGEWTRRGDGDGGMLAEAIAEATGEAIEKVRETLKAMDDETRKKVAGHPEVKAIVARIKAERLAVKAAGAPDLGELFNADDDEE